jgi:hypothetical protein
VQQALRPNDHPLRPIVPPDTEEAQLTSRAHNQEVEETWRDRDMQLGWFGDASRCDHRERRGAGRDD